MRLSITPTGFDVGLGERTSWHLRRIEKRPFGTPGKVLEEFEEYLDAQKQGLRLVMAFELADMIGALAGCFQGADPWEMSFDTLNNDFFVPLAQRVQDFVNSPQDVEIARTLLAGILVEGAGHSFHPLELLQQAQLRAAVYLAGEPC